MSKQIEFGIGTAGAAQFESPLSLWIAIWQRQLVYGQAACKAHSQVRNDSHRRRFSRRGDSMHKVPRTGSKGALVSLVAIPLLLLLVAARVDRMNDGTPLVRERVPREHVLQALEDVRVPPGVRV